jgi:hypothetical protein
MVDRGIGSSIVSRVQFITVFKASRSALGFTQAAIQRVMVCDLPVVKRSVL